jgi:hypothetical protein
MPQDATSPNRDRRRRLVGVLTATGVTMAGVAGLAPSAQAGIGGAPDHTPITPTWTRATGVIQWGHLTAADLDGDGNDEVIAGDQAGTIWAVRAATGEPLWTATTPGSAAVDAAITVLDTDGDGKPELYTGLGSLSVQQQHGGLASYSNTGQLRWSRQFNDIFSNWHPEWGTRPDGWNEMVVTAPQVGDVDGDGRPDLVVAPQDNRIHVLDPATGLDRPWWDDPRQLFFPGHGYWVDDAVFSTPLVADIDGDGRDEIVVGVASTAGGPVDHAGGVLIAIEFDGAGPTTKWVWKADDIIASPPVLADLDQDGRAEIVVGSGYDYVARDASRRDWRRIHVIDPSNGERKWFADTNGATYQQPAVADIDGDGRPEIVAVTDPRPGDGRVHAIGHDGALQWSTAPATCFPGVGCEGAGGMVAGAIVGDVDGDGDQDVLAATGWGLFAMDGATGTRLGSAFASGRITQATPVIARSGGQRYLVNSSYLGSSGLFQGYLLPSSSAADAWPQWRFDARNSGIRATVGQYVGIEPTSSGNGYWRVTDAGKVVAHGDARHHGDQPALLGGERVSAMSATPTGDGYWLFTNRGRVFPYGTARSFGDMSGVPLNGPVLDSQVTPTGNGYYMVASDGGVFAFGDAVFAGSMGGRTLNRPVESLVPDPDGRGYWLVASDGGVFAFEAPFVGAIPGVLQPGQRLNAPVSGMVPYGNGYVLVATDGGAFVFSDQPFFGSRGDNPPAAPVLDVATTPGGYWMLAADGEVLAFGSAKVLPSA